MTVGDVNSDAKGSGARYNDGKPPLDLIPLRLIAEAYIGMPDEQLRFSLLNVGQFQETGDRRFLLEALFHLGQPWIECAEVFGYGRKKYASWNWAKGMNWSVPIGCIGRHWLKIVAKKEELDDESGLSHRGHIACNIVMLLTFVVTYPEGNDLPIQWLLLPAKDALFQAGLSDEHEALTFGVTA